MQYTELMFKQKDPSRIYPDAARRTVAIACDGMDIDRRIFNRTPDGHPISGTYSDGAGIPPRILFDGGIGFIRMYGIGNLGSQMLNKEAPAIFSALYKHGFMGFDHKEGEMDIEYQGYDSMYVMRSWIVAKTPDVSKPFINSPLEGEIAKSASQIFLRGMSGVAKMLDQECMDAGKPLKFEGALPQEVTFLDAKPFTVKIKPGVCNAFGAAYKDILLSMPCKLTGPWSTGLLRSRGYGLIRPFNPTKAQA